MNSPSTLEAVAPVVRGLCSGLAMLALSAAGCTTLWAAAANEPARKIDSSGLASHTGITRDGSAMRSDLDADATYRLPGFIDKDTTLEKLRRRFGKANVEVADIPGVEGETSKGIILFGRDPTRRAELFAPDETQPHAGVSIRVSGKHSRWHMDNGVRLGMTLDALVALNGQPIGFFGLDWDYGGTVEDWHNGRLVPRAGDPVSRSVSLRHDDAAPERSYPSGSGSYRSDDADYPKQGTTVFVGEIVVGFGDGDDA